MIDFVKMYLKCTWPERAIWTGLLLIAGFVLFGTYKCATAIYAEVHVERTCTEKTVTLEGIEITVSTVKSPDKVDHYVLNCKEALDKYSWTNTPWDTGGFWGLMYALAFTVFMALAIIIAVIWIMSYVSIIHDTIDDNFLKRHRECTNSMLRCLWLNFVGDVQYLVIGHSNIREKDIGIDRVWMR